MSPALKPVARWLLAALVVGLVVRLPGVAWGVNWPDGFTSHHPDEYTHVANADAIITPRVGHQGLAYPKAMGAYAAAPYLLWYLAQGQFGGPRIHIPWTIGAGRMISVLFGLASILIVFAIGRDAFGSRRVGVLAAWLLALGGLHVTQSHFFLADVPALTWTLLAVWLLWRDLRMADAHDHESLRWAAFAAGSAFALKLFVFVLPALAYAVFARGPRLIRATHAAMFGLAAIAISSLGFDTTADYHRALTAGINYPFEFDRLRGTLLYLVQLPSLLSLPLLLAATVGTPGVIARVWRASPAVRRDAFAVFGSVPLLALAVVLFKLDPFPRHLLFLIPWAALSGGWALARLTDGLASPLYRRVVLGAVFIWMAAFVIDSERFFIAEPRNAALHWLRAHAPPGASVNWVGRAAPKGFRSVRWMVEGDPEFLVFEMHEANNSLSGVNWRNSYPSDHRLVFDGRSPERVQAIQALFRGTSERYDEVARFSEGYVMPEYRIAMTLLGDRSRSYISEIVVFRRKGVPPRGQGGG